MVKSTKAYHDDFADDDDGELGVKVEGKSAENRANPHRSKHSESEQRRRSKINERFQLLRDLLPQNDQKRDKASFLLEVIEYIQFLHEKVQLYEGSYQYWSSEPTKLTPWRNHDRHGETFVDPLQVINGSAHENNVDVSSAIPANATVESLSATTIVSKSAEHPFTSPNVFNHTGTNGLPTQPFDVSGVQADHVSKGQSLSWQARLCTDSGAGPSNAGKEQEELTEENGSETILNTYSQGILNTLTQALQFSGVDLLHTSISVNVDVRKREISGASSKDCKNEPLDNQLIARSEVGSLREYSEQAKRLRLRMDEV